MKNRNIYFLNRGAQFIFLKKNKITLLYAINVLNYIEKYFEFTINFNFIVNKQLNCIIVMLKNTKKSFVYLQNFQNFINSIQNMKFVKWVFFGKGFKMKKNNNASIFNFNNSHIKVFVEKKLKLLKLQKNVFIILIKHIKFLKKNLNYINSLFKLNVFTKRGIRISNLKIFQKKIKKK